MKGSVGRWLGVVAVVVGGCSAPNAVVGGNDAELASGGAPGNGESVGAGAASTDSPSGTDSTKLAVGEVCVPPLEHSPRFNGFALDLVTVQDEADDCASGICLIQRFRGRVSCPLGNESQPCFLPGSNELVAVAVEAQLVSRPPSSSATCSCRCAGPGPGPFCECGADQECVHMLDDLGLGENELAGSYCVPRGATDGPAPRDDEPSCAQFPEQCASDRPQ